MTNSPHFEHSQLEHHDADSGSRRAGVNELRMKCVRDKIDDVLKDGRQKLQDEVQNFFKFHGVEWL